MAAGYSGDAKFREYYSGCGMLSILFAQKGINVKSYECYPKEGYRIEYDIGRKEVIHEEVAKARRGETVGAHFGIVCSSWSALNRLLNSGTRTKDKPQGNNTLQRGRTGNEQAAQMFRLIKVFDELKIPYSVENPESSALWWLSQWSGVPSGTCDQCMLGLRRPEKELQASHRVQKKTRLAGTVRGIESFSDFKCDRCHKHSVVIGSVKVDGKRINRSTAAGAYPRKCCRHLVRLFAQHLEHHLANTCSF